MAPKPKMPKKGTKAYDRWLAAQGGAAPKTDAEIVAEIRDEISKSITIKRGSIQVARNLKVKKRDRDLIHWVRMQLEAIKREAQIPGRTRATFNRGHVFESLFQALRDGANSDTPIGKEILAELFGKSDNIAGTTSGDIVGVEGSHLQLKAVNATLAKVNRPDLVWAHIKGFQTYHTGDDFDRYVADKESEIVPFVLDSYLTSSAANYHLMALEGGEGEYGDLLSLFLAASFTPEQMKKAQSSPDSPFKMEKGGKGIAKLSNKDRLSYIETIFKTIAETTKNKEARELLSYVGENFTKDDFVKDFFQEEIKQFGDMSIDIWELYSTLASIRIRYRPSVSYSKSVVYDAYKGSGGGDYPTTLYSSSTRMLSHAAAHIIKDTRADALAGSYFNQFIHRGRPFINFFGVPLKHQPRSK